MMRSSRRWLPVSSMVARGDSPNALSPAIKARYQRPRLVVAFFLILAIRRRLASRSWKDSMSCLSHSTRRRDTPRRFASSSTVGIRPVRTVRRVCVCPMTSHYSRARRGVNVSSWIHRQRTAALLAERYALFPRAS